MQLQPITTSNALPEAWARVEATRKKAIKVSTLDNEGIIEEATKHDRLENKEEDEDERDEYSEESKESELESK